MARTDHNLPGIYNETPIALPDKAGTSLAVNQYGQIVGDMSLIGQDATFGQLTVGEKYLPLHYNAAGSYYVFVQDTRILGYVTVNFAGSFGTAIDIYNEYYDAGGTLIAHIDGYITGTRTYKTVISTGIFMKITGSGTAPDVTLSIK